MSFLSRLCGFLRPPPALRPEVILAIERCCEVVDPLLRTQNGLARQLAPSVEIALAYCQTLVDRLAEPIIVDRQAFASHPLIHAYFASADDLGQMLGKSRALREYLQHSSALDGEYIYAMPAARQRCKKTLGMALEGEVMRSDVAVEYLFFSDHTLAAPGSSLAEVRLHLLRAAFDSLLISFRDHLNALRNEKQALRGHLDQERDQINLLRLSPTPALEPHTRQLAQLEEQLRASVHGLQPEHIALALSDFLSAPEQALQMKPISFTLDRSGRILPAEQATQPGIDNISFQQLKGRDRRSYAVFIAAIRREDAEQAVAAMQGMQLRSIVI